VKLKIINIKGFAIHFSNDQFYFFESSSGISKEIRWGFEDLDGHLWNLLWMNPEHVQ
jgi:hypothetical protein